MKIRTYLIMCAVVVLAVLLAPVTMEAQTKRALLIGVSDYGAPATGARNDQWGNIHGANDVELIAPTLKKKGFTINKITNKAVTAKRVRKELNKLAKACRRGDVVYLHFSCHGQPFEDMNGDEEDGWDESLVPCDASLTYRKGTYEGGNHILDDELAGYFNQIRQRVGSGGLLCVVVDACHAGGSSRGEESDEDDDEPICRGTKKAFSPSGKAFRPCINTSGHFTVAANATMGDIIILEACRSYQSNYEIKQNGNYYGPLSYYLNQTLQSHDIARNLNWVQDVKRRMDGDRRLTRQNMVYETSLK